MLTVLMDAQDTPWIPFWTGEVRLKVDNRVNYKGVKKLI